MLDYIQYKAGGDRAVVLSTEAPLIRRLKRWAHLYPEECIILTKGRGILEVEVPRSWIKVKRSVKRPDRIMDKNLNSYKYMMVGGGEKDGRKHK